MADAYIPYGAYWSTPFDRWQGALAHLHSLQFAAHVAKGELKRRDIPADAFDVGVLGISIPQKNSFYGMPWVAAMMGIDGLTGPTVSQAWATSARCIAAARQEIADGAGAALIVAADRTSNGPHVYYPAPDGPNVEACLRDISLSGLSLTLPQELVGIELGDIVRGIEAEVARKTFHGDLLVMHVTPVNEAGALCGGLFYPETDEDLITIRLVVRALEAAAKE